MSVREGYQILLRAEAVLDFPAEYPKISSFYEALAEKCMLWAIEVHGERLRTEFLSTESIREKSQFGTQTYRFHMRVVWQDGRHSSVLCESWLKGQRGEPQNSYHRIAHVWNLEEETALPFSQILKQFPTKKSDFTLPFSPDGIYPLEKETVFYKNAVGDAPFAEYRCERIVDK
jgi:hypothetical protein